MTTFQAFLHKMAAEQQQPSRRQRREEWVAAVSRLLDQIRAWLAESDPERLLDVVPLQVQKAEPDLGVYTVPSLKIGMGVAAVQVVPVGRDALGVLGSGGDAGARAQGRIDITDGVRKSILYRVPKDGTETWYALDENLEPAPLDRARLEVILQDLLA